MVSDSPPTERLQLELADLTKSPGCAGDAAAVLADGGFSWQSASFPDTAAVEPSAREALAAAASAACQPQEAGIFLAADAVMPVYSLTKSYMAYLVVKLAAESGDSIDSAPARRFPQLPFASTITVRQLLSHTSGLPDYGPLPGYHSAVRDSPGQPWTQTEFLCNTLGKALEFQPGSGWSYCNIGYLYIRLLIELMAGASFANAIREHVTERLFLPRTRVLATMSDWAGTVPGWSRNLSKRGQAVNVQRNYHPGWAAHGLVASAAAEAVWSFHSLLGGELLPEAAMASLQTTNPVGHKHHLFRAPSYSLGLMADPDCSMGQLFGHSGSGPGYTAACYGVCSGKRRFSAAVLTTGEGCGLAERTAFRLMQIVGGARQRR